MTDTTAARNLGGRPRTGRTPDKVRQDMAREELAKSGGRRFEMRLSAAAAADLAHIRRREGLDTDAAAAIAALHYYARLKSRNKSAKAALAKA